MPIAHFSGQVDLLVADRILKSMGLKPVGDARKESRGVFLQDVERNGETAGTRRLICDPKTSKWRVEKA